MPKEELIQTPSMNAQKGINGFFITSLSVFGIFIVIICTVIGCAAFVSSISTTRILEIVGFTYLFLFSTIAFGERFIRKNSRSLRVLSISSAAGLILPVLFGASFSLSFGNSELWRSLLSLMGAICLLVLSIAGIMVGRREIRDEVSGSSISRGRYTKIMYFIYTIIFLFWLIRFLVDSGNLLGVIHFPY
jgi:hypothetical protein